jgi:hypothetical protein
LLNEYRDLLKEAAAMQLGTPGTDLDDLPF